jgi:hypothetical protein
MKSSNWNYHVIDDVEDYLLKESISSEILDITISNNMLRHKHQAA